MARFRKHMSYADTRAELAETKDIRRGAAEDAFWDENELIDHRPSRKTKRAKRGGCPENNGKAHVYVWVGYTDYENVEGGLWARRWYQDYEIKVCCGCLKRKWGKGSFRRKQ